jgi:hypothetical protein
MTPAERESSWGTGEDEEGVGQEEIEKDLGGLFGVWFIELLVRDKSS